MFGSLLERPLVAEDAVSRYPRLVSMFDRELDGCKNIYNKHIQIAAEQGEMGKKNFHLLLYMLKLDSMRY